MARHETRTGVCFPGTGIAHRREPECRAPMFGSKLKHRKENRHHEKLHTPPVRACPELRHAGLMTSSAIAELERPSRVACSERLCEKSVMFFEQILLRLVGYKHEPSHRTGPLPTAGLSRMAGGLRGSSSC